MTSKWEVAAVIGPLVLSFLAMIVAAVVSASPAATAFFQRSTRRVLSYAFPSRGRCHVLSWDDIPPGHIHRCNSSCQHVNPQAIKPHDPANCWEDSVEKVFNQLSSSSNKDFLGYGETITKPYQLPLFQDFIRTDAQTLKAFLLLTMENCRSCQAADLKSLLEIKTFGDVATVHLKVPPLAPVNTALTKFEVDRMIDGYPPFYRSMILTPDPGSYQIAHPTKKSHHLSRGAWVFAVGLSANIGPVPSLYNMQQLRQKNDQIYWKGTLAMNSFDMIGRTLSQLRLFELRTRHQYSEFTYLPENSVWGDHALSCYDLIMSESYSLKPWIPKTQEIESQLLFAPLVGKCPCTMTCLGERPHSETCGRGQHLKRDSTKRLSAKQCEAALQIFNNHNHSEENLDVIAPVLLEVFQIAILGMSEVEHYFSRLGQELDFPEVLKDKRHIYLRTCAADSE